MPALPILNNENFLLFAAKNYGGSSSKMTAEEFYEDLERFKMIKKAFSRYRKSAVINERLTLNHIIILYNVFPGEACTRMLFQKTKGHWDCLAPFLSLIGRLPARVEGIEEGVIWTATIQQDIGIAERLRRI